MVDVVLRGGRSFKDLGAYLVEGPRGKPRPAHALGEILYLNLPAVRDPRHAFGIMAATARDADALKELAGIPSGGRPGEKPVYHIVLSWSLEERVTEEQVHAAVEEALLELGLEDRQAVVIVHRDTDHLHVHVMVNRVSPEDGRFAGMGRDWIKLSRWAKRWEQRTFGRTFCRRPYRGENLRVVQSTYNQPGMYPIRCRSRKRPVRDQHHREAWRRLLADQRAELDAEKKAGGDVAAVKKQQKTERVKLALELRRTEEQRRAADANQVDPDEAATVAKSEDHHAPDTADAAKVQPEEPTPANNVSELAQRPPESEAPKVPPGPADETSPVPIPEPVHVPEMERVEAVEVKQLKEAGGDGSALKNEQEIDWVELVHELSRMEEQHLPEDPPNSVEPEEATTGAKSRHARAPDPADAAKAQPTDKPVRVEKVSELTKRSPELEASKTPSEPADETRSVPISEPAGTPKVQPAEATEIKQANAATEDKTPPRYAGQRRVAQQTSEPAGPGRAPAKSVDRDPPRDRSGGSVDRGERQRSKLASPVAPPRHTRRDADSRPPGKLAEQPRAKEQRPAADENGSAGGKTGSAVKSMHDRPVEATGRAMKKESYGPAANSNAAGPVRHDGAAAAASHIRTGLPMPPAAADETRAAPIAEPVRARAMRGGTAVGTGQTQAPKSAGSHAPPAKSASMVLPAGERGRVDGGHPPKPMSTSPKGAAATSAETRRDDGQPSAVCLKDYGSQPAAAVTVAAAVAGINLVPSSGATPRKGIFRNNVHVPTMSTPDAQHAADLWACALKAPPLDGLNDGQRIVAAASVAQSLADALGTRRTFDAGRPKLQWPPPAAAPLRDIVRRAVEWFVQQLQALFERRRKGRDRKMASFRAGLGRYAAGGTMDDRAGPLARPATPMSTARKLPGRTSAIRAPGATTPPASGGLVVKAGAASPKAHPTGTRTPSIAASGRVPARSNTEASPSAASGRTDDQQRIVSTSSPTAPSTTSTAPAGTPDRARPVREVEVPSLAQLPPDGDRLENAAGAKAKPATSQATDSVQAAQPELSGRTATPVRGSSGESVIRMIARKFPQRIEAEYRSRYGETLAVPAGIWESVREAAGDDEDKTAVIDVLIERAERSGGGDERDRAETEYLEHLPEVVKARTQPAKLEPEQSSWSLSRWFSRRREPPETTTATPDLTAVLDEARQRHVQELLERVSNVVRDWRERLEMWQRPSAETSRSYRDAPWRRGHEPAPSHDRNQPRSRW